LAYHLTKRKRGKNTYYYLAQTNRIDGSPKQKILRSLGTADEIMEVFEANESDPNEAGPDFCRIYQFGAEAALLGIAERLGVAEIIDDLAPKRNQGLSVGSLLVLSAINRAVQRAVQPSREQSFYEWFLGTVLTGAFPEANEKTLSSQSFWNQTLKLDQKALTSINDEITNRIVKNYGVSTNCLLIDKANFITYTDTSNPSLNIKRGHSEEKRSDLNNGGLSLMFSLDYNIPLFYHVYQCSKYVYNQIIDIFDNLSCKLSKISNNNNNVTIVFGKGDNSVNALKSLENGDLLKFHFVGELPLNQLPELLEIKKESFRPLAGDFLGETTAFRLKKALFGQELTVIITDNPKLKDAQIAGLNANIFRIERKLLDLQNSLKCGEEGEIAKGTKLTALAALKKVEKILSAEHMKKVFSYNISSVDKNIKLIFNINKDNYNKIVNTYLGKTILFTNRNDWSSEQIIAVYRSRSQVKDIFKQIKSNKYLPFSPINHFTDNMVRVHTFYCILSSTLSCLLRLEMEKLGFKMSANDALKELSKAKQSLNFYLRDSGKKPRVAPVFTQISASAEAYLAEHDLKKYALK
jgi:transposase